MAHAPMRPGENESLTAATEIPNPRKSWAIYGELHEHEEPHAHYYRFNIAQGEKIYIMLFKSRRPEESTFLPSFVLMGPELNNQGNLPTYVEKPNDVGYLEVTGEQPSVANYEPFSPSSFYSLADLTIEAPASGTYYIAVYASEGGHYGLAVGDIESYGIGEWILLPISLISIYQWEGQSLPLVLTPYLIVLAVGIPLLLMKMKKQRTWNPLKTWIPLTAGLLFLGTGASTSMQMILSLPGTSAGSEAVVTAIFILIPIVLGGMTIKLSLKKETVRNRVYLLILGVLALLMWTGLIIGPLLLIIASLIPPIKKALKHT